MIHDKFGRSFKKLRISLTHDCNYACIYCSYGTKPENPEKSVNYLSAGPIKKVLPVSELIEIIFKLHSSLDLKSVRLTGGEPLLHPAIIKIVKAIKDIGISNIGMTTNGHLLKNRVKQLYEAGLKSVNISIDALSDEKFTQISGKPGLSKVLNSIEESISQGLNVKLNTVIVAGQNEMEILPLMDFALKKGIIIRFLELMPMGPLHENRSGKFFSSSQMLDIIRTQYSISLIPREENSTADYWGIEGKKAFGIIANDSSPFCSDCNRLRLDSYGNLYGCLSSLKPVSITTAAGKVELQKALKIAISHKQPSHFIGNSRTMQSIGG